MNRNVGKYKDLNTFKYIYFRVQRHIDGNRNNGSDIKIPKSQWLSFLSYWNEIRLLDDVTTDDNTSNKSKRQLKFLFVFCQICVIAVTVENMAMCTNTEKYSKDFSNKRFKTYFIDIYLEDKT